MAFRTAVDYRQKPEPIIHLATENIPFTNSMSKLLSSTRKVGILVFPHFSHLTLASVIEPMRVANKVLRKKVYDWTLIGIESGWVSSSSSVAIQIDTTILESADYDTLFIVTSFEVNSLISRNVIRFVRNLAAQGSVIAGFETGAYVMAAAGILDGYRATLHWVDSDDFRQRFPKVDLVPDRFVVDRKRSTTGGSSPALDFMLDFIKRDHGSALAITVSGSFHYDQDYSASEAQHLISISGPVQRDKILAQAISLMESNIESPPSIKSIAREVGVGERELQRRFHLRLGTTPIGFFNEMRLSLAYRLLEISDRTVIDIAMACGFTSGSAFARAFRARYDRSPSSLRRS